MLNSLSIVTKKSTGYVFIIYLWQHIHKKMITMKIIWRT